MTVRKSSVAALAATALLTMMATPARAQDTETVASHKETAAQLEFLKAQIDALQTQLDTLKKTVGVITPTWKGTPEFADRAKGFSFRLSGELQYDVAQVGNPRNAIVTPNLGFNGRARRILVGAAGSLPGDFSYSLLFNIGEGVLDYEDMILEYAPHTTPMTFTIGYFYPFSSMENMMNNRFLSFVERAQFNDAIGNGRRLGIAATYLDRGGDFRLQAGLFNEGVNGAANPATPNAGRFDRTGYQGSVRAVYSPVVMGGQAHLAASFQHRQFKTDARGIQYRARPFSFSTDQRLVATGNIAARSDEVVGVEAMYIHGPVHVGGEAQYVRVDGYRPGDTVVAPQAILGTEYPGNFHFLTGYIEAGYWLTGETRGYRNARIDRTRIVHPVDTGGIGGIQIVGRVDYLDLTTPVGNPAPGSGGVVNGGRQIGYLGAVNYWPIDYLRFTAEYAHADITGGPFAAVVVPVAAAIPAARNFGTDIVAVRAQIDF